MSITIGKYNCLACSSESPSPGFYQCDFCISMGMVDNKNRGLKAKDMGYFHMAGKLETPLQFYGQW